METYSSGRADKPVTSVMVILNFGRKIISTCLGLSPCPVTVTTRIIIFLVGNHDTPLFDTVTGRGTTQGKTSAMPMSTGGVLHPRFCLDIRCLTTVDGRNPANHLGCKKPCKQWDKLPTSTG